MHVCIAQWNSSALPIRCSGDVCPRGGLRNLRRRWRCGEHGKPDSAGRRSALVRRIRHRSECPHRRARYRGSRDSRRLVCLGHLARHSAGRRAGRPCAAGRAATVHCTGRRSGERELQRASVPGDQPGRPRRRRAADTLSAGSLARRRAVGGSAVLLRCGGVYRARGNRRAAGAGRTRGRLSRPSALPAGSPTGQLRRGHQLADGVERD